MTRSNFTLLLATVLLGLVPLSVPAQESGKIYSPARYRNEPVNFCLNFQTGLNSSLSKPCDLRYGLIGINSDFDWIQASTANESRSLFKDVGSHTWVEAFEVPVVATLPKLNPGEQRTISIDASGANGSRGTPGFGGFVPKNVDDRNSRPAREPGRVVWSTGDFPDQSRAESRSKLDPTFVKAVVGHMYVAHIVNDSLDYYALFRVDALENQTCSISWKLIPSPKP